MKHHELRVTSCEFGAYRVSSLRSGISLMEVLISIGIMAIGMLSIASLLPVGNVQTQRATTEERKAEMGLNVYREFQIRGMANPKNWARHSSGTSWVNYLEGSPTIATAEYPPIVIDPFMIAVAHNAQPTAQDTAVDSFPANGIGGPVMKRLTVTAASTVTGTPPAYSYTPNRALADAIFTMTNELVVDQPEDRSLPATSPNTTDVSEAQYHRPYEGNFSWLATIAPQSGTSAVPASGDQCILSIVIFERRRATAPSSTNAQEEMVEVNDASPPAAGNVNITGGEMTLGKSGTTLDAKLSLAKPGSWLMLCRTDGTTPPKPRIFKWYRIVSSNEASTAGTLDVTLAGPDWVWGGTANPTYACLFDGVVAVYERSIHLEDPSSIWNQ